MLNTILRYYHTLKYLQWIQIKYRLFYLLFKSGFKLNVTTDRFNVERKKSPLQMRESIMAPISYLGTDTFTFLNIDQHFDRRIDWNFQKHGKLWTYNLNYFEYLSQPGLSKHEGLGLIHDFINKEKTIKDGMESFPISLRVIFWIKFLIKHQIDDAVINQSLIRQLQKLSNYPEYHLMGNHLLENGFSLLFGGCYFKNEKLIDQARGILKEQLDEQILADGGHFELSPMYHQLMLYRILDCINLLQQYSDDRLKSLKCQLQEKAGLMLGWTNEMIFRNGQLPMLNDSTYGVAPDPTNLRIYAECLGVKSNKVALKESGYRKIKNKDYELLIDVGQIGPDYIPGHAHSDTFNFILHYAHRPLIVDSGISTYEKNKKRTQERSTSAHNTVMIAGLEQSEIWGGFRVARRAKVFNLQESPNRISATHDGYRRIHTFHQRTFHCQEGSIAIIDEISNQNSAQAFIHFHPEAEVHLIGQEIHGAFWKIKFENLKTIKLEPFQWAAGFNKTIASQKAVISFQEKLQTKIYTHENIISNG